MVPERIEKLRQQYTDKYVVVNGERPELARFEDMVGQVKTINFNGRALVQFDANDNRGWHDIELDYLKVVEKPERKQAAAKGETTANARSKKTDALAQKENRGRLSPLERARMAKQTESTRTEAPANDAPAAAPAGDKPEKEQ